MTLTDDEITVLRYSELQNRPKAFSETIMYLAQYGLILHPNFSGVIPLTPAGEQALAEMEGNVDE